MAPHGARAGHKPRCADQQPIHIQTAVTGAAIACAVAALVLRDCAAGLCCSWPLGTAAAFVLARRRDDNPLWHAGGVLYIGLPALALVALARLAAAGLS